MDLAKLLVLIARSYAFRGDMGLDLARFLFAGNWQGFGSVVFPWGVFTASADLSYPR